MTRATWTYDVALSFAGEDREVALELATRLHSCGLRVFFDRFEELWGQDLSVKLHEVYGHQSRYCVVLVSKDYLRKPWTNHERRILVARAMQHPEVCLLPIRVDDTELPGLAGVIAHRDLRSETLESIVGSLRELCAPGSAGAVAARDRRGLLELVPSDFLYGVVHADSPEIARFNLGYHLINPTAEAQALQTLEATITPPGQRGIQFMWQGFVEIGERYMQPGSDAFPYALSAGDSRLLGGQFVGPTIARDLLWREGTHTVEIVGWVERNARHEEPDLHARFELTVSDIESAMIRQGAEVELGFGIFKAFAVAVPLSITPSTPA